MPERRKVHLERANQVTRDLIDGLRSTKAPALSAAAALIEAQVEIIGRQESMLRTLELLLAADRKIMGKAKDLLVSAVEALSEEPKKSTDSTP